MGSGSGPIGDGGTIDRRFTSDAATAGRAEAGLRRLLPGLGGARVERAWGGPIDVSADHLPFFATKPGTRIHYGAGYSGHGVGPSWLGGQILASLVLGADDEWTRLPLATRRVPSLPPEPLRRRDGVEYSGLVLNERGWNRFRATGLDRVNVTFGATETFNRRNANASLEEAVTRAEAILDAADGTPVTVTISVCFGCPFEGRVD